MNYPKFQIWILMTSILFLKILPYNKFSRHQTISFTYNPLYFYYISCDIGKHFSYYVVPFIILCASKNSILLTSWLFLICTMFPLLSYFHVHNSILMTSQFFFTLFFKLDSLHVKSIPWTATKAALAVQNWKMI